MEVILRDDVPGLGIIGDVVKVKPGYARNYLLPRGLAVAADRRNLKELEHQKRLVEVKKQRERGTYERLAESLAKVELEIEMRAGHGGKLFGSVTNLDVGKLLAEKGFEIDRRRIVVAAPIKEIGRHEIRIKVGQDIGCDIALVVKPVGGELEDVSVDGEDAAPALPAPVEPAADTVEEPDAEAGDSASGTGVESAGAEPATASADDDAAEAAEADAPVDSAQKAE